MAINARELVTVNPRVSNPGSVTLEMNGVLITNRADKVTGAAMAFASEKEVGELFGFDSEEYKAASAYFLGFEGSSIKPTRLYIGAHNTNATPYVIKSNPTGTWEEFVNGYSDGAGKFDVVYSFSENGGAIAPATVGVTIPKSDLEDNTISSFTAYANKALELLKAQEQTYVEQGKPEDAAKFILDATFDYDSDTNCFVFTSGTTGNKTVVLQSGDGISGDGAISCGFVNGGNISGGLNASTPAETMAAISGATQAWTSFTTTWDVNTEDALGFAAWSAAQGVTTLYVHWTGDASVATNPPAEDSVIAKLIDADAGSTTSCYAPDCRLAAFVMGAVGSINYEGFSTVATMAFRKSPGMPVTVADSLTAQTLDEQNVNYYGDYATRNATFKFFQTGRMYGDWGFIDPYINAIWLNNALQNSILQGFQRNNRVPYNNQGYAIIRGWLMDPITKARNNGVIDTGMTLSEAQLAEVMREVGQDVSTDLQQLGYFIQIEDPPASTRANRMSPIVNLWYTYAGSVQKLVMGSIAIL